LSITKGTLDINSLDDNFSNLNDDIVSIDIKLSEVDQLLLDLKNTVSRTQAAIRTAKANDKGPLYRVINTTMELMSSFYQTHQRFAELKYRYRKEQDDLTFKTAHFIQIELRKIESQADASHFDVIDVLKKIASMDKSSVDPNNSTSDLPPDIQKGLNDIDDDSLYSLK